MLQPVFSLFMSATLMAAAVLQPFSGFQFLLPTSWLPVSNNFSTNAPTTTKNSFNINLPSFTPTVPAQQKDARQQINSITSYLDGSVIYGSDAARAAALRTFQGGKLKTSAGDLLPFNTAGLANANDAHILPDSQLFLAGDVRANENIELSSVQTLMMREHNYIAERIEKLYPNLSDEEIYQQARRIVIAEMQAITYNEFLPAFLGPNALTPYYGYRPDVNASVANEFSTGAYRVGHTLINSDIKFLDNDGNEIRPADNLAQAFFNPTDIIAVGVDPILKYLSNDDTQEVDLKLIDALRNFLFGPPGAGGLDLASMNIQRGRDHGLADYNSVRAAYGLPRVRSFSQITSDSVLAQKLKDLYGSVDNIDLWVGGLAEDHLPHSSVGPTFSRIIADQFERIRDGDRFWYQRTFSGRALQEIQATKLSDIIRRNTDITKLQDNVFYYQGDKTKMRTAEAKSLDVATLMGGLNMESRSYDGSGNNTAHPSWGMANTALLREAPSAYGDGVSTPAGANRPSPRLISNTVSAQSSDIPNARDMSDWIYAWGQFVDHDIDLTTAGDEEWDIPVPKGDPYFDPQGTGTAIIPFARSNYTIEGAQWTNSFGWRRSWRSFHSF